MAFVFDPNQTPLDGAEAVALLVANLVSAGWAIHAYGTGAGGARVGGGVGFGAALLRDLSGAWVELVAAGVTDSIALQRSAAGAGDNTTWTFTYAKGGFAGDGGGDTIDSTVAGDLQTVYGPGALFPADDPLGACRLSCGADDASAAFYLLGWNRATGEGRVLIFCDVLTDTHASDASALVFYACAGGTNPGTVGVIGSPSVSPRCWHRYGLSGAVWAGGAYETSVIWGGLIPNGIGLDPFDGKDILSFPRFYYLTVSGFHLKGSTSLIAWNGRALTTGYTLDLPGAGDDRVSFGDISLPWPAGVAAVV